MKFGGIGGPLKLSSPGEGVLCVGSSNMRSGGLMRDGSYFDHCWTVDYIVNYFSAKTVCIGL